MKRIVLCILMLQAFCSASRGSVAIVMGQKPTDIEKLAAVELKTHLYAATGKSLPIRTNAKGDAIVIGTPTSNRLVARFVRNARDLGDEGYLLRTVRDGNRRVLIVAGNTPNGVLYGVYALLEEYGFGFYLGGNAIPPQKAFRLLELNIRKKPVFKIRGTLPWYNFFNSPTVWDYEDYCWFFDQLVKCKNNFVGFHVYDIEPFTAYKQDGKYVFGEPVANTRVSYWGTTPMKTSEFGFGTHKYFHTSYFGSKPSLIEDDREKSISESQDLLRRALLFAKARGLKVCVGFEMNGEDPTDPAEIQLLENRLKHLLKQYPMLDYVWVWEAEALGVTGKDPHPLDSRFGSYYRKYEPVFAYLNDPRRQTEAVRLAIYAREAHRILKENAPKVRMILSGWGGDNHLRCTDYYLGLDKILPKDIVFAALDNIIPSDTVSANYAKLSADRERWPIPWFEFDGDQWHPQPWTKTWLSACRDALRKGSTGILGIHWRTRDVEEAHAAMSQFAWNPEITYEQFYEDYAAKCFGRQYATSMASILKGLQSLGYRWIGGWGQSECGAFGWGTSPDQAKVKKLEDLAEQLSTIHSKMQPGSQRDRVAYLYQTAMWVLSYERTAALLRPGGTVNELFKEAHIRKSANIASQALAKLYEARFGDSLHHLSMRITNKGELGILATVNTKAYASYRSTEQELRSLGGKAIEPRNGDISGPKIVLSPINPNTTWLECTPMPVKVIVHRDGCRVFVVYRSPESKKTTRTELEKLAERYFEGPILCPKTWMVEYYLEAVDYSGKQIARWPSDTTWHVVTITPKPNEIKPPAPLKTRKSVVRSLKVSPQSNGTISLNWVGSGGPYLVRRSEDGKEFVDVGITYDTWFEDVNVKPGIAYTYAVKPQNGKQVIASQFVVPIRTKIAAPLLETSSRPGSIRLTWGPAPMGVTGYRVYLSEQEGGPWTALNPDRPTPASNWHSHTFLYRASDTNTRFFRVVPLDRWNNKGPASPSKPGSALPASEPQPSLALDFDDEIANGHWALGPSVTKIGTVSAAVFEKGNYIVFPHHPEFSPTEELTLSVWVNLTKPGLMPVLLCKGAWQSEGYFLQAISGQFRFYLHGIGEIDGGRVEPGKWTHIACVWDGAEMSIYQNGKMIANKQTVGKHKPSDRNLYVGRYEYNGKEYEVEGMITGVRLYPVALSPEQIEAEYLRLCEKLQ